MEQVKLEKTKEAEYVPVINKGGKLKCVSGYELIKIDANTYRCTGGAPHIYRFDDNSVILDKFGNLMLKRNTETDNAELKGKNGKKPTN